MLETNQKSLDRLTDLDWVQTLLIDCKGHGVEWANFELGRRASEFIGDYIWVLDDDDVCTYRPLITDLKRIVKEHNPDAIMLRMDFKPGVILPPDELWGKSPQFTRIGMSSFVLRRAVFQRFASMAFTPKLGADYRLIRAVFDAGCSVYWHDVVAMRCQRAQSRGAEE